MSKKRALALLALTVAIAGAFAIHRAWNGGHASRKLVVSGNIEVTDSQLSFKVAGRVLERLVNEGQTVQAGQLVARLESDDWEHEVAQAEAAEQAAAAELKELEAGSRPEEIAETKAAAGKAQAFLGQLRAGSRPEEIAAAEAAARRAAAELEFQRSGLRRREELFAAGVVPAAELDSARRAHDKARAEAEEVQEKLRLVRAGPRREEIEQAEAAARELSERHARVKNGPRAETIEQARARLERSKAATALAKTRLSHTQLFAPYPGIALAEHMEPGEFAAAGMPVITLGNLRDVWLRAYVNETSLGRVKQGQKAEITVDAFPGKKYPGVIGFISSEAEFTPKNVQTHQERVKLVYRLKIDVANPDLELKPGMPADAEIDSAAAPAR